jgi:hypothetical protein
MTNYVMRHGRRIVVETLDTGIPAKSRGRKNRDFVMITRTQFERLCATRIPVATFKVFLLLQFLVFRSRTKSVRLANVTAAKYGISRIQKRTALMRLETLGVIQVTRCRHRSPEIVVLDLL